MAENNKLIPRWCAECSHHFPKDGQSSLCGLRKCTMKPAFHPEGIDRSELIKNDCGGIQGWRGRRVLDVLGEAREREARAAELQAMTKKLAKKKPASKKAEKAAVPDRFDVPWGEKVQQAKGCPPTAHDVVECNTIPAPRGVDAQGVVIADPVNAMCRSCVSWPGCMLSYPGCKRFNSKCAWCTENMGCKQVLFQPDWSCFKRRVPAVKAMPDTSRCLHDNTGMGGCRVTGVPCPGTCKDDTRKGVGEFCVVEKFPSGSRTADDVAAYHQRHKKKPGQERVGEKPAPKKPTARMKLF